MRIFFDVSSTHASGAKTGIQRVVRSLAMEIAKVAREDAVEFSLVICNPNGSNRYVILDSLLFNPIEKAETSKPSLDNFYGSRSFRFLKRISVLLKRIDFLGVLRSRLVKNASKKIVEALQRLGVRRQIFSYVDFNPGDVLLVFDAFWGVPNFLESAIRAKKLGAKLVLLVNDIFPITHPEFTERNNKELFNQKIFDSLDLADGLLYPSNVTKDAIIANILPGGITIPNQRVLYGASSDNETFWFYEQVERIPGSILMLGTIEPRKNHRLVLKWFLIKAPENTTLTIIGADGWENEEVKSILRRESMKKPGLSWLKEASDADVAFEMMRHEIGLFASHGEGLGLPVIEYSAAGLKLVLSDIPVFREVAGDSGFYFDHNSIESLDDAISRATAQEKVLSIPARSWDETAIEVLVFCRKYFD
jgi:glycosyltransferase involved in cell wall biosynthesis